MPVLNKENVQKWVAALRSGDYKQTKGVLRKSDTNEMCCLGVLCDLYSKENDKGKWGNHVGSVPFREGEVQGQVFDEDGTTFTSMPPPEVTNWSGMGLSRDNGFWSNLADANDAGATFEEIADRIEKRLAEVEATVTPTS
jgi:hypothetical protein